mgnify:CR=1 FL=1
MNIVGCILFVIAGIIVIKVSGVTKKQGLSDYSNCNRKGYTYGRLLWGQMDSLLYG